MKPSTLRLITLGLMTAGLLSTSGCDLLKKFMPGSKKEAAQKETVAVSPGAVTPEQAEAQANDPVLVSIDGEPVLRKEAFLTFAKGVLKSQPYLANFGITSFETSPPEVQEQLIDAAVQQELLIKWGEREKVEQTAEFKDAFGMLVENMRRMLIAQTFEKQLNESITVSDQEVTQEYNNTREAFIKDPGALTVVGASFSDTKRAHVFAKLVEQKEASFEELAKESKVEVTSFGQVAHDGRFAKDSTMPAVLRRAVLSLDAKTDVTQVQDGETHWVLFVSERGEPDYFGLDQVREQVASRAKARKFLEAREERMGDLRGQYAIDIARDVLGKEQEQGQQLAAMLQQMAAGAQEQPEGEEAPAIVSA